MNLATSSTRRGFTLIELLVVIAIIGILSAVVLASLNTARTKGTDAAIKSNLSTVQTQAELYYNDNGNYGTAGASAACSAAGTPAGMFTNTTIKAAVTSAATAYGGSTADYTVTRCAIGVSGASYAASVKLKSESTNSWFCVDSNGVARVTPVTTDPIALGGGTAAAACP